jgi:hypothetical protein
MAARQRGCIFYQSAPSNYRLAGVRRIGPDQTEISLGPIFLDLQYCFQLSADTIIFDDSASCHGNAAAVPETLLPFPFPAKFDGTIAIGNKLLASLHKYEFQMAAVSAICAHEFGHLLQFKYVDKELSKIVNDEDSSARAELFADFVCGYYAGFRRNLDHEWPAAVHALVQFRAGDYEFGRQHHGTPKERGKSVENGFMLGNSKRNELLPPGAVAELALNYVKGLTLEKVHSDDPCGGSDQD